MNVGGTNFLDGDDGFLIKAPPVAPPPVLPPPPPPPPTAPAPPSEDLAGKILPPGQNYIDVGDGTIIVAPKVAPTPPGPIAGPPEPTPDTGADSLDVGDGFEGGAEPDPAAEQALQDEADAIDAGARSLQSISHPAPGEIIGTPYVGTHSKAFNIAGGSDNWQSENAVDIWLVPGTAILAVEAGTISPGGYGYGLSAQPGRFAGWRLHLVTSSGRVFFYTHMRELLVPKGAKVAAGQIIGRSGTANGVSHLHFAVTPPFLPGAFAKKTYDLSNRSKQAPTPAPGLPPVYPAATFTDLWHDTVDVFALTVPAAHARLKANADSLKEIFT